jgi:hypothetical protein
VHTATSSIQASPQACRPFGFQQPGFVPSTTAKRPLQLSSAHEAPALLPPPLRAMQPRPPHPSPPAPRAQPLARPRVTIAPAAAGAPSGQATPFLPSPSPDPTHHPLATARPSCPAKPYLPPASDVHAAIVRGPRAARLHAHSHNHAPPFGSHTQPQRPSSPPWWVTSPLLPCPSARRLPLRPRFAHPGDS